MNEQGTRWSAKTARIDADTGEFLTKHKAETEYIHIKTLKEYELNKLKTKGTIIWTKLYRRSQQGNLFK